MLIDELKTVAAEERAARAATSAYINVCGAAGCQSLESDAIRNALVEAAATQGYGEGKGKYLYGQTALAMGSLAGGRRAPG